MSEIDKIFDKIKQGIMSLLDKSAKHLYDYAEDFVCNSYKEAVAYWPVKDEGGAPIKDSDTGKPYEDKYNPSKLAYMVKSKIIRNDDSRSVKLWVDAEGLPDSDKFIKIGRLMEVYGPRPWGKLKSMTIGDISKVI